MIERSGVIEFKGKDAPVIGVDLATGQIAPEFSVHNPAWETVPVLKTTTGKVRIIAAVPSLDTSVCDREIRRFNQEAAALCSEVAIIVISTDLPYAQKRWCGATGIDQVLVVSDHHEVEFGIRYGCLMKAQRILRRAIFVINRADQIVYAAYMKALGEEPDYAAVLAAAIAAL